MFRIQSKLRNRKRKLLPETESTSGLQLCRSSAKALRTTDEREQSSSESISELSTVRAQRGQCEARVWVSVKIQMKAKTNETSK